MARDGFDIRIDGDGGWHYRGSPIRRPELVRHFASLLTVDENGDCWLVAPTEMGRIRVDDAPFVAVELFATGAGRKQVLEFRTNVGDVVTADSDHPIDVVANPQTGEPSPYVTLRARVRAKITRAVYYGLVDKGRVEIVGHEKVYGVWSSAAFFPIGRLDLDDATAAG